MIRVGQKLKEERLQKGLTIEDVSKATKIKVTFLQAIEKGEYAKLPSSAYAHGFVKNYASFLGFSPKESLALFRREFDEKKSYQVLPESFAKEDTVIGRKFPIQQTLGLGIIFFVVFLGYIVFQYQFVFLPPKLVVVAPKENQVFTDPNVVVNGTSDVNATVSLNSSVLSLDEKGNFQKIVRLFPGKQTLTLKAVSRFGKETVVERHIQINE